MLIAPSANRAGGAARTLWLEVGLSAVQGSMTTSESEKDLKGIVEAWMSFGNSGLTLRRASAVNQATSGEGRPG
jgi:hypothetical protein